MPLDRVCSSASQSALPVSRPEDMMIQQDARVARAHKQIVRTMLSRSSTQVMPAAATNMHNEARTTMSGWELREITICYIDVQVDLRSVGGRPYRRGRLCTRLACACRHCAVPCRRLRMDSDEEHQLEGAIRDERRRCHIPGSGRSLQCIGGGSHSARAAAWFDGHRGDRQARSSVYAVLSPA